MNLWRSIRKMKIPSFLELPPDSAQPIEALPGNIPPLRSPDPPRSRVSAAPILSTYLKSQPGPSLCGVDRGLAPQNIIKKSLPASGAGDCSKTNLIRNDLAIHFTPMTNSDDFNNLVFVIDRMDNSVVADPNAPRRKMVA
jgi:hypothetical protein